MNIKYVEDKFSMVESKETNLPNYGRNVSGYGNKMPTQYKVRFQGKGKWYRVYCVCFSNVGSIYVIINNEKFYFRYVMELQGKPEGTEKYNTWFT